MHSLSAGSETVNNNVEEAAGALLLIVGERPEWDLMISKRIQSGIEYFRIALNTGFQQVQGDFRDSPFAAARSLLDAVEKATIK